MRSNFISLMNTKTYIFTRGYRHPRKYCFWCPFGEIKLAFALKKNKKKTTTTTTKKKNKTKNKNKTNMLYLFTISPPPVGIIIISISMRHFIATGSLWRTSSPKIFSHIPRQPTCGVWRHDVPNYRMTSVIYVCNVGTKAIKNFKHL